MKILGKIALWVLGIFGVLIAVGVVRLIVSPTARAEFARQRDADNAKRDAQMKMEFADKQAAKAAADAQAEIDKPKRAIDALRKALEKELSRGNRNVPRITTVELLGSRLAVHWAINDNLTAGMTRSGAAIDAHAIAKLASKSEVAFDSLFMAGSMALVDRLGNSSEDRVVTLTFNRETLAKINWDGLLFDRIYAAADTSFIHPAFRER